MREWLVLLTGRAVLWIDAVIRTFLNYCLEKGFREPSGREERVA